MLVHFIGVGEAIDEQHPNTSILISLHDSSSPRHILLDCGFTAAAAYYARSAVGAGLDAVWISHFHGDHFFGLPLLLLRFQDEGRSKPLTVIGPDGVEAKLWSALDLAYPGFRDRLHYPVHCLEVTAGQTLELFATRWSFAMSDHSDSAPCLAVRLDHGDASVFYSGDGRPTTATEALANGASLLIHEAYGIEADTPGHGGVHACLDLARAVQAHALALVHVNRRVRQEHAETIRQILDQRFGSQGILPESGEILSL